MYPDRATIRPDTPLASGQLVALFLMRLVAYMARLNNDPRANHPDMHAYLVQMITAAEQLVHAFVRMLTSEKLKRLGYVELADAMRSHDQVKSYPPAQTGAPQLDITQLNERLQQTLSDFDEAELLASHLARMIVMALNYRLPAP